MALTYINASIIMAKIKLDTIQTICEKESAFADDKLKDVKLSPLEQQYFLGKKHAAQEILQGILVAYLLNKESDISVECEPPNAEVDRLKRIEAILKTFYR